MKAEDIKLIIWDLDDTFWQGTITEGNIIVPKAHKEFLLNTTDMGIIHSICSKNTFSTIQKRLREEQLWDYFVFPSIDWNPKGARVKNIIETMRLRAENVVFIDDNIQNIEEVKHYCPAIMALHANNISWLISLVEKLEKKDPLHKRLKQYHQMEQKEQARIQYQSNDEFLFSCNIQVEIKDDCINEIERIHELIMRSNQLNYTKYRQTKEDLMLLIGDVGVTSGYVKVRDKFGDYGLIGFFALKNNELIHYVFSCRTLGMKVEQFVYSQIKFPNLNDKGEVVSELNQTDCPKWINQKNYAEVFEDKTDSFNKSILLKGPCDMSQMYAFFSGNDEKNIITEFTYMNDSGVSVEGHNHTAQIVTALYANEERKSEILNELNFFDKKMLTTRITDKFDAVVLSMLTDGNLGVYRRKSTGELIALLEKKYPLDLAENREKYIRNEVFTSQIKFDADIINKFSELYEFVDNSDFTVTIECLEKIYKKISSNCIFILLLGSERPFQKVCKSSYKDRHIEHKKMNALIKEWAKNKENVVLLSYDDCITSNSDFLDTINHFTKKVYYEMTKKIIAVINEKFESRFTIKGKKYLFISTIKQKLRYFKKKIIKN